MDNLIREGEQAAEGQMGGSNQGNMGDSSNDNQGGGNMGGGNDNSQGGSDMGGGNMNQQSGGGQSSGGGLLGGLEKTGESTMIDQGKHFAFSNPSPHPLLLDSCFRFWVKAPPC
jgi:hypothetical protein